MMTVFFCHDVNDFFPKRIFRKKFDATTTAAATRILRQHRFHSKP